MVIDVTLRLGVRHTRRLVPFVCWLRGHRRLSIRRQGLIPEIRKIIEILDLGVTLILEGVEPRKIAIGGVTATV